jgi:hypothetical protein
LAVRNVGQSEDESEVVVRMAEQGTIRMADQQGW